MKKAVLAATAAALIAGSAVSYAANPGGGPAGGPGGPAWRPTAEDQALLLDARLAALKTGLKLNAEQQKLWPGLENALREVAKDRAERRAEMRAKRQEIRAARQAGQGVMPDPITRMRDAAEQMDERAKDLRTLADAAEPLYKTLDAGQKRRLELLIRHGMAGGMAGFTGHGPRHGMAGPGGKGPGGMGPAGMGAGGMGAGGMGPGGMGPAGAGGAAPATNTDAD